MGKEPRTYSISRSLILAVGCLAACANPRPPATPAPASVEPEPVPATMPSGPASWSFNFAPGAVAYRVSRNATITGDTDPQLRRETSTNSTYESLILQRAGDTIAFTAVVDTFATTTQGAISSAQPIQLPVQLSGVRIGDSMAVSGDSLAETCNPATSALITDLHNLLPHFPVLLTISMIWKDSTQSLGCQGSIPTRSRVLHSFRVLGENMYEGARAVIVQRNDTVQAEGEGAQQRHHLTFMANGTGSAVYHLDAATGRIMHLSVDQDLSLSITASGKTSRFHQTTKQEFVLVR